MFSHFIEEFIHQRSIEMPDTINAMMEMELVEINEFTKDITVRFSMKQWQENPMHTIHGGILATLCDMSMGCLSYALNGGHPNPTVEMQLRYLHPVFVNDILEVHVHALHTGSRLLQLEASVIRCSDQVQVVHASASYIVNDSHPCEK